MLRVVTDEEIAQNEEQMSKWWDSLGRMGRQRIYHFVRDMMDDKDVIKAGMEADVTDSQRAAVERVAMEVAMEQCRQGCISRKKGGRKAPSKK